jgi:hypothetical protein
MRCWRSVNPAIWFRTRHRATICERPTLSAPIGVAIGSDDADAWNTLAFELKQAELLRMGNEHVAYEAQEEEELKTRMGGYYNALADGGCDAIMDEIHVRLQCTIPHVNEVRWRLGDSEAQQYRSDIETLEDRGWNLNIAQDEAVRLNATRRCAGRAQELRDVTRLVGMAALPTD